MKWVIGTVASKLSGMITSAIPLRVIIRAARRRRPSCLQEKRKCGEADYQLSGQGFEEIMLSITRCEDSQKRYNWSRWSKERNCIRNYKKSWRLSHLSTWPNPKKKFQTTKSNWKRYSIIDLFVFRLNWGLKQPSHNFPNLIELVDTNFNLFDYWNNHQQKASSLFARIRQLLSHFSWKKNWKLTIMKFCTKI